MIKALSLTLLLALVALAGTAQTPVPAQSYKPMVVEIWSDVVCPFCYIGKRKFEAALAQFAGKDSVTVVWRSFQLDPTLETEPGKSVEQSLSEKKGWSMQHTREMTRYVTDMANGVGLDYHFERTVVANSRDAHRFSHFARLHGKQNEAEEKLFSAYFIEGKNIADHQTLADIGAALGLDAATVRATLASDAHATDVGQDIELARGLGINSVPFFVFDRKLAVSGAQDAGVFLQTLERAARE